MITQERPDLRAKIIEDGKTITQVAERMDITRVHLSNLLRGISPWSKRMARDFSMATGIPLATILPSEDGEKA